MDTPIMLKAGKTIIFKNQTSPRDSDIIRYFINRQNSGTGGCIKKSDMTDWDYKPNSIWGGTYVKIVYSVNLDEIIKQCDAATIVLSDAVIHIKKNKSSLVY